MDRIAVLVLVYNQREYIDDLATGILRLTNLDIYISDDCSTDGTYECLRQNFEGVDRVFLRRNSQNLGLAHHFYSQVESLDVDYIMLSAGDDILYPYCDRLIRLVLRDFPNRTLYDFEHTVFKSDRRLNVDFEVNNLPKRIETKNIKLVDFFSRTIKFSGCSRLYSVSALKNFGAFKPETPTEDTTSLFRCLLSGDGLKVFVPMTFYRIHDKSLTQSGAFNVKSRWIILRQYLNDLVKADFERSKTLVIRFALLWVFLVQIFVASRIIFIKNLKRWF